MPFPVLIFYFQNLHKCFVIVLAKTELVYALLFVLFTNIGRSKVYTNT